MRVLPQSFRRKIGFAWGRAWPLRSIMIPKSLKREAMEYLKENQHRLLFVMGSGRSGTQLISDLLDASGKAIVFHEPNFHEDVGTMDILRRDPVQALRYWQEFRSVELYRRWKNAPVVMMYGEVNGTIRYQVQAIRQLFPEARMVLMTRDGRGVVRSVIGWPQFYGPRSKGAFALEPLPGDPFEVEWPEMSRFEKICWGWQDTYELLMRHIPPTHWLTLEQSTSDFDYFDRQFTQNVGLSISRELWKQHTTSKSRNSTKVYGFPSWEEWTAKQQEAFIRICGPTMNKLGYRL